MKNNKVLIIGGGAGGGAFAARVRRHDNNAEIKIYERSPFVSYSNCGQPYLISGEKPDFESIIVYSKKDWKEQYNVDAITQHEVIAINRKEKNVIVKDIINNKQFKESYDYLVIAAGSPAIWPNITGIHEADNIHVLKTPDQLQSIMKDLKKNPKNAVVVGGGYIGLEIAENLKKIGINVTIIDKEKQLISKTVDEDFSVFVNQALVENGVNLILGESVEKIADSGNKLHLSNNKVINSDITFMVVGVKPELKMYKDANIEISKQTNGIKVDVHSLTNDKNIYAIGDIAETIDWLGKPSRIQLAIVAQRMATVGANHMYGVDDEFAGVQNSASVSIFGRSIAGVGYTEKYLKENEIKYHKVIGIEQHSILHGENVYLKVLYDDKGFILGAQVAGPLSSEKRINYAAMAQMYNIPIEKLLHFQTAYNPVIDTQRDPINLVARIARAQNHGIVENITVLELDEYINKGYKLLDVRTPGEYANGAITNAKLFPLQIINEQLDKLDKNEKYVLYCRRGARAYNFQLRMKNAGFKNVVNLLGAWDHYKVYNKYKFANLKGDLKND